jgi:hypothetical protein
MLIIGQREILSQIYKVSGLLQMVVILKKSSFVRDACVQVQYKKQQEFNMDRAGDILDKLPTKIEIKKTFPIRDIQNKWSVLVGNTIASHTYASFLQGQTLFIKVDTPQWLHHLSYLKQQIIEKLQQFNIHDLKLSIGTIPDTDIYGIKFVRKKLSKQETSFIANTTSIIEDEELRQVFKKFLTNALSIERKGT